MFRKLPKVYCLQSDSDIFVRRSSVANLYYFIKDDKQVGFFKKIKKTWLFYHDNTVQMFEYLSELFKAAGGVL